MTTQELILDIAMNLTRIGNWALDDFEAKRQRIEQFLNLTDEGLKNLTNISQPLQKTLATFKTDYHRLKEEYQKGDIKPLRWGEDMLTWGNILTHRAKLA